AGETVSDVRIEADRISRRQFFAELGKAQPRLRPEYNTVQPGSRFALSRQVKELSHPGFIEALRRHPHLRLLMKTAQIRFLFCEQREHRFRLGLARISARNKNRV